MIKYYIELACDRHSNRRMTNTIPAVIGLENPKTDDQGFLIGTLVGPATLVERFGSKFKWLASF